LDKFIENLGAKAPVLRWEASCTLGNLARVDDEKRILSVLPIMYPLLEHKSIVLANHTVQALAKIAEQNQEKAEEILNKLIEKAPLFKKTTVGFIIEAVARFKDYDDLVPKIREFVEPYLESEMKVVAKKAKKTLKKLG
jgi:transcription elongation factor GreA-like protein